MKLSQALSTLVILASATNALILPESSAKSLLRPREKRANSFGEEALPSNFERECVEEACTHEEYMESAENSLRGVRTGSDSQMFEIYYAECRLAVQAAGLDGRVNGRLDVNKVNLAPACMKLYEHKISNVQGVRRL